jgi:hypothetical protein
MDDGPQPVLNPMNKTPSFVVFLISAALLCAATLLLLNIQIMPAHLHAWVSSLPLALAGAAYAILQFFLKPSRRTLLKRLLLAATFILWAIDQILPPGRLATVIGDVVISAYVLDLFWIIQEQSSPLGNQDSADV